MLESQTPLVSIITPAFNHEKYIGPCIESVLKQTYQNWEQIIIDDGSTDRTAGVVRGFADGRVRYVHQENKGIEALAHTYNHALSMCKGELVAILEGDDMWPTNKLATLTSAFADEGVVLAYGEAADVNPKGLQQRTKSHTTRLRQRLTDSLLFNDPIGSATRYMLLAEGRSLISPSSVVIRRSTLEGIGGFQYVPHLPLTDYPTFIELSLLGKFHYSAKTMGYRRRHQNSVTVCHAKRIHDMVSDFTMHFLDKHLDRIVLSPSELEGVQQSWREAEDKLNFSEGRFLLLQRNWPEARTHFRVASNSRKLAVRLAAFAGFFCSWIHTDIEPLMKLGGRAGLRAPKGI